MLFGNRKKQAFGQVPGMAMMQPNLMPQPEMQVGMGMPEQQPAKFKPNLLGVLGDAAQVFAGGQATYMQGIAEQRQRDAIMRQRAMQAQQERETGWQDWVKKEEYKRANPEPVNNDTVNDLNWYKSLSDDDRKLYHQMKPVVSYMADGTPRIVNPYEMQAPSGPKPGMIEDGHEFLGGDPKNPASWKKVGGSVGNGTNGFR